MKQERIFYFTLDGQQIAPADFTQMNSLTAHLRANGADILWATSSAVGFVWNTASYWPLEACWQTV